MNELLAKTLQLQYNIELYHRNTLRLEYNLHSVLGSIKDSLFEYSDKIGEYIIKEWDIITQWEIYNNATDKTPKWIYMHSQELVREYIDYVINYYTNNNLDKRVENYLIDIADNLEQEYAKLQSTLNY